MSDPESNEPTALERGYLWCGLVGAIVIFAGLVLAHIIPPPPPSRTAAEVAEFYRQHRNSFRTGTAIVGFGAAMLAPWMAVVATQLHRIPGHGRSSSYCFLGIGMIALYQVVMPLVFGQAAAFRPERSDGGVEALNDVFFLQLVSPAYLFVVQLAIAGVAILADSDLPGVFPRWIGYISLFASIGSIPGVITIFFKHGPWAWNGLFGWWIPVTVFGIWVVSISYGALTPTSPAADRP